MGAPRIKRAKARRPRYLGSWVLPSGNSCDAYLVVDPTPGTVAIGGLRLAWDRPPSPSWPREDVEHYQCVTYPEIVRAMATATGLRVLGVAVTTERES